MFIDDDDDGFVVFPGIQCLRSIVIVMIHLNFIVKLP